MSQVRSPTNSPCNPVDAIHQCVPSSGCGGADGPPRFTPPPTGPIFTPPPSGPPGTCVPNSGEVCETYGCCSLESDPTAECACTKTVTCAGDCVYAGGYSGCSSGSVRCGAVTPGEPPAPIVPPGCAVSNLQARVQKDVTDPWKGSIVVSQETFIAGALNGDTGQLVPAGQATIKITGPNFDRSFTESQASVDKAAAGTYSVTVTSPNCDAKTATVTVQAAATPVTTNTNEVARVLLKHTSSTGNNDYTLFCDSYDRTLNYYSYAKQGDNVRDVLNSEAGNVCVLKYGTDSNPSVMFGTVLKKSLAEADSKIVGVIGDICDSSVKGEGNMFKECTNKKVWHRKKTDDKGIVVYSKSQFTMSEPEPEFARNIADLIRKVFGMPTGNSEALALLSKAENADRIYVSIQGGKRISGMITTAEGRQKMVIEYKGFTKNPCSIINTKFAPAAPCSEKGGNLYLIDVDCTSNAQICSSWLDLTAKSRLQ